MVHHFILTDRTVLKKLPTWKNERLVMFGQERVLQRKTCLHGYKGLVCCRWGLSSFKHGSPYRPLLHLWPPLTPSQSNRDRHREYFQHSLTKSKVEFLLLDSFQSYRYSGALKKAEPFTGELLEIKGLLEKELGVRHVAHCPCHDAILVRPPVQQYIKN